VRGAVASARGRKEKGIPVEGLAFAKAQKSKCDQPFRNLEKVIVTRVHRAELENALEMGDERQAGVGSGPERMFKCIGRKLSP